MKSIAEISIESHAIYKKLITLKENEVVTYEALSEVAGSDFREHCRGNYQTACRIALRENKMVFECVRNVGVKRLANENIPAVIGGRSISKTRKIARTGSKKILSADYAGLSDSAKLAHNTNLSVLGAIIQFTKPKNVAVIEKAVNIEDSNRITFEKTLELFKEKKNMILHNVT